MFRDPAQAELMDRAERDRLRDEYRRLVREAAPYQTCAWTGDRLPKSQLHPHHPYGRHGRWVLEFVWLRPDKHDWIHAHPDEAYALGWLQPEYRGVLRQPGHPVPWKKVGGTVKFI